MEIAEAKLKNCLLEMKILRCIAAFRKEKEHLAEEIQALILQDPEKKALQDIACGVPGISPLTGSLLVQMLSLSCTDPKQWIAFFGLDVSQNESGKTKRREKLSKRGNAYLRKRLYSAGWGAIMNYEQFRTYYEALKKKGEEKLN